MLDTGASCSIINHRTFLGSLRKTTPNRREQNHQTKKDLLWSSCAHDRLCHSEVQLRPARTIFVPFNSLDNRIENTKPLRYGRLSRAGIWHSL